MAQRELVEPYFIQKELFLNLFFKTHYSFQIKDKNIEIIL